MSKQEEDDLGALPTKQVLILPPLQLYCRRRCVLPAFFFAVSHLQVSLFLIRAI